ncbi:MAG: hypothetical protein BHV69_09880 [Bacteroidales bacterium 52_46]|nr:MAG: hypothetical protein BHV69_09880 [Bacteroidales bacterium 52_46]
MWDKGYYDYDYAEPSEKTISALTAATSDEELTEHLKRIGFGVTPKKHISPEEAQRIVMEEIKESKMTAKKVGQ